MGRMVSLMHGSNGDPSEPTRMINFLYRFQKASAPKFPPLGSVERAIAAALLKAVGRIRDATTTAAIVRSLEMNDIQGAIDAVRVDLGEEFLLSAIPQRLRTAYEASGAAAVADAGTRLGIGYSFNIVTPWALDWVRENTGSLIRQWGDSSRDAMRKLIVQGFQEHIPSSALARMIKDTGIGLTWRQARAVLNMRHRLEADGLTAAQIDARTERYFKRLLRYRSEMIARTEMARATEAARREAWRQAIGGGLIDPLRTEKEWLATNDQRCCDECADLDGTRASMPDGHFIGDGGTDGGQGPPQHPACRCRTVAVAVGSAKTPRARVNIPGDTGIRRRKSA